MSKLRWILVFALIISPALAESTAIDRVGVSLGQCVSLMEQRVDEVNMLRKQLIDSQAKIKELEGKMKDNVK